MMRRFPKILLLLVIAVAAFYGYKRFFGAGGMPPGMGMMGGPPPVSVAEVIERNVRQWHEFSGRLVAVDSAEIRPQVSGTIQEIHFEEGQWVEKGQHLFTIDQRPYAAALQAAQARALLTKSELQRAKKLIAEKAIPQRELDQRNSDAASAQAALTQAMLDYDHTVVKSPIKGRASRAEITVGNLVDAGGNAPVLTTVVSDSPIYADFDIDEQTFLQYLQAVGPDTEKLKMVPVSLGLANEEGTPHVGSVQSFDNRINMTSGTIRVRAVFSNDDRKLVPGLFARLQLGSAEEKPSILVTERAIGTDQSKKFVLVVGPENKVEHREVKLGTLVDGLRVITEGLKPGEKIIVSGTQRVMMPGQPVTPEPVQMDGQPSDTKGQSADKILGEAKE